MDTNIIEISEVSKSFNKKEVISNFSMNIKKGEIYGFLGENGAGKTTVMKMILNLIKPTCGTIKVQGELIDVNSMSYLQNIGNIIEYPVFYNNLSALENMNIYCKYQGIENTYIDEVLSLVGLRSSMNKKVCEFSLGMKQRLGIARSLVNKPAILILDEPINGLDPIGIKDVRAILKKVNSEWNTTILISSHIVSEIESIAHRLGIIQNGIMLEELDVNNLKKNSDNNIVIELCNDNLNSFNELNIGEIVEVIDKKIIKLNTTKTLQELTKILVDSKIEFNSISTSKVNLEEYFINLIKKEN